MVLVVSGTWVLGSLALHPLLRMVRSKWSWSGGRQGFIRLLSRDFVNIRSIVVLLTSLHGPYSDVIMLRP